MYSPFIFLFITLATFSTNKTNAAFFKKREISSSVQECIDGLRNSGFSLSELKSVIDVYDPADFSTAIGIKNKEDDIEIVLENAVSKCCGMAITINDEEGHTVIEVLRDFVLDIESTLNSIIEKKTQFESNSFVFRNVKKDINYIGQSIRNTDSCLISSSPPNLTDSTQGFIDQIDRSFDKTRKVFGI